VEERPRRLLSPLVPATFKRRDLFAPQPVPEKGTVLVGKELLLLAVLAHPSTSRPIYTILLSGSILSSHDGGHPCMTPFITFLSPSRCVHVIWRYNGLHLFSTLLSMAQLSSGKRLVFQRSGQWQNCRRDCQSSGDKEHLFRRKMTAVNISILVHKGADGAKMHTWSRDIGHIGSGPAHLDGRDLSQRALTSVPGMKGPCGNERRLEQCRATRDSRNRGDRVSQ